MTYWEKTVREEIEMLKNHFGFMPRKSTITEIWCRRAGNEPVVRLRGQSFNRVD